MTIQAIETRYAGCRFRSRQEARWAVFFDHLKIGWTYEEQGYEFDGEYYLPDFTIRLQGQSDVFVEVKGTAEAAMASEQRLSNFVRHVKTSILILTTIPRLDVESVNVPLHGALVPWNGNARHCTVYFTSNKTHGQVSLGPPSERVSDDSWMPGLKTSPIVVEAYEAARSARFEHGESGSPKTTMPKDESAGSHQGQRTSVDDLIGHLFRRPLQ